MAEQDQPQGVPEGDASASPGTSFILTLLQSYDEGESIDDDLLQKVTALLVRIESPPENTIIDLWLDTGQGSASAAYRLCLALRSRAHRLRVVVPNRVKGAGMLAVLAADEIIMSAPAELGPLDTTIGTPAGSDNIASALALARAPEKLNKLGMRTLTDSGHEIIRLTGMTRKQSLSLTMKHAERIIEPLLMKYDPRLILHAMADMRAIQKYAGRVLNERINRSLLDPARLDLLSDLPARLVSDYDSAEDVIDINEARELGLEIRPLSEYKYRAELNYFFGLHQSTRKSFVMLLNESEIGDLKFRAESE